MKVFDNCVRGIHINNASSLMVGNRQLFFDESLLCAAGSTFGNLLVNAELVTDELRGLRLFGVSNYDHCANRALVKISLTACANGEQELKNVKGEAQIVCMYSERRQDMHGKELTHFHNYRKVDALVVLTPGSTVSVFDRFQPEPSWKPFRWRNNSSLPTSGLIVDETRFSYNGDGITRDECTNRAAKAAA